MVGKNKIDSSSNGKRLVQNTSDKLLREQSKEELD